MKNLRIVGTRGKKRKKYLKLLGVLGVTTLAVCVLAIYAPPWNGHGGVHAGEDGVPPGIIAEEAPLYFDGEISQDLNGEMPGSKDAGREENEGISEDEREISFGPIGIGPNIKTGDYIDIRLMCADGTDYIVASKKKLIDYNASTGMSVIRVRESELLTLNSAMTDRNSIKGVTLYAVRYIDPLLQSAADISYQPNEAVSDQIRERENDD